MLETHTDQTLQYGTVSFTDSPDTPILLLLATGWHTEASVWDALNTDVPVPLGQGDEGVWRQVYDQADVWSYSSKPSEQYSGLVAIAGNKEVRLFDSLGKDVGKMYSQTVAMNDWATGVEVNPGDTSIFAVASNEGQVELYRLHTFTPPRPLWTFRGHSGTVNQLRWSKDGTNLVTASQDGTVRVWRVPTANSIWWSPDWVLASTFTADGNYLMGFTPGGYVVRSDRDGTHLVNAFVSTFGQLNDMSPSPDGQRAVVLTTYCDPPIRINVREDDPAQVNLDLPDGSVTCPTRIAWNPSAGSQQVVAGTTDGRVIVWDADTKTVVDTAQLDSSAPVLAIDFSGDGTRLVVTTAGAEGRRIYVLNASDLSRVRDWRASDVDRLDVSYDGDYVATAGNDSHQVQVWDVEDADAPPLELAGTAGTLSSVTLSQDKTASRVAATTSAGLVYVWSRDTGQILAILRTHSDATNQAAFDPDDINRIVSAGDDGEMTEITCEVCAKDVDGLDELAEQREVQVIELK